MMTLEELQKLVITHEEANWHDTDGSEAAYTRHILEHLCKLIGKMGNVVEPREHGLEPPLKIVHEQVIPDLLYFALGLAHKHGINLEETFLDRLSQNKAKIDLRRQGILETPSV